jgi:hypothetical protein
MKTARHPTPSRRLRWVTPMVTVGLVLGITASAAAHDLFLRLQTFFVPPNTSVRVYVLNGTFSVSDAPVARDRVADISLVGWLFANFGSTHWFLLVSASLRS